MAVISEGLWTFLQACLDVVDHLDGRLGNAGAGAEDTADALFIQKLVILKRTGHRAPSHAPTLMTPDPKHWNIIS